MIPLAIPIRADYAGAVNERDRTPAQQRRTFLLLWIVFFFHGMVPGFWIPALTNILKAGGHGGYVAAAFAVPPLCALISPLVGGSLADQRCSANRLFAWTSIAGAFSLMIAFAGLYAKWPPAFFLTFLGGYSLMSGPAWGLLATISLATMERGEHQFPRVRMGATLGWVAGGLLTSYVLRADTSPIVGLVAGGVKILAGGLAFLLPEAPPLGRSTSWKSLLGMESFRLLKQRDQLVFFGVTLMFSIPITAFYTYSPELLSVLGDTRPAATMTIAQASEVVSMLLLGSLMTRFRVKTLLLVALGLSVVRFGLCGVGGATGLIGWHIAGIALHGMCYTLYFVTAQIFLDRRVEPGMRGQAQGLLSMITGGLGPLAGALLCGWLRYVLVKENGGGWDVFWWTLSSIIAVCFVAFAFLYRGRDREVPS